MVGNLRKTISRIGTTFKLNRINAMLIKTINPAFIVFTAEKILPAAANKEENENTKIIPNETVIAVSWFRVPVRVVGLVVRTVKNINAPAMTVTLI